jgi:nitroreductase
MNETIKNILERHSVRDFSERKISREDLELIVLAAESAPSGKNRRTWKFTVVQNKEMLKKLSSTVSKTLNLGDGYDFYRPDVLILASSAKDNPLGAEDCACALENIFVAANSLGIGSVWINQFRSICDEPAVRAQLSEINLPDDHIVRGCAALGYPAEGVSSEIKKRSDASGWIL